MKDRLTVALQSHLHHRQQDEGQAGRTSLLSTEPSQVRLAAGRAPSQLLLPQPGRL
jgi:hypothetical protein